MNEPLKSVTRDQSARHSLRIIRQFIKDFAADPKFLDLHAAAIGDYIEDLEEKILSESSKNVTQIEDLCALAHDIEWNAQMIIEQLRPSPRPEN